MQKLMIMGAGIYQVPLIRKAREMGIYTIAVSIPGPYPGFALADEACYINTTDQEAVLAAAREKEIDGIVTVGTDVAVITIGRVCDELGLPGLSCEAARISTDKTLMKECFARSGVRTAAFRKILLSEEPLPKTEGMHWPLIVKTVDSSGSRGITRVDSPDQLPAAVEAVRSVTHKDYYLIEEFITGEDFGAQAFVSDGVIRYILPHGNYMFRGDTGVPAGHYLPFAMSEDALADLKEQVTRAIRGMGLNNCAVNADLILKDGKTYIVELTGRGGATGLTELNSILLGCDLYEQIIRAALGEEVSFGLADGAQAEPAGRAAEDESGKAAGAARACACRLLRADRTGVIDRIINENDPADERICETVLDYGPGDTVRAFHVGPDRIGHLITRGDTLAEAEAALTEAERKIRIEYRRER